MSEKRLYWAYIKKSIVGPFTPQKISEMPGFNSHTLICPQDALGQWKECSKEEDFSIPMQVKEASAHPGKEIIKKAIAENEAFKNILEKTLEKNRIFENEIEKLKIQQKQTKEEFEISLKEKDETIKALRETLEEEKRKNEKFSKAPSWERLYEELRISSKQQMEKVRIEKQAYINEIDSLKNKIQAALNAYETSKNKITEKFISEKNSLLAEISRLKAKSEDREEMLISMKENIKTLVAKNNELQKIIAEEKIDKDKQNSQRISEISNLNTELAMTKSENEKLKEELENLKEKMRILNEEGTKKDQEQEEIFKMIHSKIKLLNAYFSGVENKLKRAEE